jgi:probable phosphoglycerate mutase
LIRHGESRATVERFIGGSRTCTGLTDFGRLQVQALRDRLITGRDVSATVLMSSNFPRAVETAQILAPALGSMPIDIDAGWGEHDPGPDLDGMSWDAYVSKFGTPTWSDPDELVFPGGETVGQFHTRVVRTLRETVRRYEGGTIVVACHGGVVDAVMRHTLQMHQTGKFELHTLNTSLTEIVHVEGSRWRLVRYNDAAHLSTLQPVATPDTSAS